MIRKTRTRILAVALVFFMAFTPISPICASEPDEQIVIEDDEIIGDEEIDEI